MNRLELNVTMLAGNPFPQRLHFAHVEETGKVM